MGLETFNFIDSLNSSNPVGATDPKSQGDNHIRGIKSTLLSTFPNITGAVTLTHTQLNDAARLSNANTFSAEQIVDAQLNVRGAQFRIYDATNTDYVRMSHDGTDFDIVGFQTTDINLSGITSIQAGTVDADFDAITATSYGGIAEANLVDKSAAESISGVWTFGTINATTVAGILGSNLVDKSAIETISGNWTFSGTLNNKDPDAFVEDDTALSATNTDAAQPGFKGAPKNTQNGNYTLVLADAGKMIYKQSGGAGETITIPANSSVAFPIGTIIEIVNDGGGNLSVAITGDTLEEYGSGLTGTRTLGDNNKAVIEKVLSTTWKYLASDS